MHTYHGFPPIVDLIPNLKTSLVNKIRTCQVDANNTFIVIGIEKSFSIYQSKKSPKLGLILIRMVDSSSAILDIVSLWNIA